MSAQLSLLPPDPLAAYAGIQPRFAAYCRAHGTTPEEQLARDRGLYPGGLMVGFLWWVGQRWREWEAATGRQPPHDLDDHRDFDVWLAGA
jgi:hypothetical protein